MPGLIAPLLLLFATNATPTPAGGRVEVPAPSALAVQHFRSGVVLWVVGQAWTLAVPALLLATGTSARLRSLARRGGRSWLGTVALYSALYVVVVAVAELPLTAYAGYFRPHAYSLSRQGFGDWLLDAVKRLGVGMGMAALFLWVPYALMAWSPRRWWLLTAALVVPWLLAMGLVKPVLYDPLFHDFGPMHDRQMEARILGLAARAGVAGGRVYEVDMSRETSTVNAYVTGLGGTRRIVLWDTLLARLEPDEVLAVMGHEMGHYVLGHVATGLLLSAGGTLVGLACAHATATRLLSRPGFRARVGFDRLGDVASVPLLALLLALFHLATSPLSLAVGRHLEHEADRFALEVTRDNHACASAFVKLQRDNLSVPRPGALYKYLRATHPPIGERIDFANDYRPWLRGPGKYERLFVRAGGATAVPPGGPARGLQNGQGGPRGPE